MLRERILAFFDPSRSPLFFIVGTAALTVVVTAIYDSAVGAAGLLGAWLLAGLLLLVALAAIAYPVVRRRVVGHVAIRPEQRFPPRRGLILLVSPRLDSTAQDAIRYHLGTLQSCWLISSPDSYATAGELAGLYAGQVPELLWRERRYVVDPDDVEATYAIVARIFDEEAPARGIAGAEIIADITGGMKPMTAGMALACLARNRDMQYMQARRDERGEPDKSVPAEPIRIDTTFYVPAAPGSP